MSSMDGTALDVLRMAQPPVLGVWNLGDVVMNTLTLTTDHAGWICTSAGIASGTAWLSGQQHMTGDQVNANGNVYRARGWGMAGKTAPNGVSDHESDGGVGWQYVGPLAQFIPFGAISPFRESAWTRISLMTK